MVRVVRLERTVSWSQTRRDTNFAIPGYSLFCHDTTASGKNKVFSVCGHSCGQNRFCAVFGNRGKSSKRSRCKALRRFALPRPGYGHGTPKPPALPAAPHPDLLSIIPQLGGFFKSQKKRAAVFPGSTLFAIPFIRIAPESAPKSPHPPGRIHSLESPPDESRPWRDAPAVGAFPERWCSDTGSGEW